MDEVIKDAIGRYGAKIVELDDRFEFHCTQCGKCCTNREDILLTPRDLFRAAKELNMAVKDFFSEYCEKYIGDNLRLPVIRLKPRGTIRRCPLLENRRCRIHKSKPVICAMFPVGRMAATETSTGKKETSYLLNPIICVDKPEAHTVHEWLLEGGMPVHDEFFYKWHEQIGEMHLKVKAIEGMCSSAEIVHITWDLMSILLRSGKPDLQFCHSLESGVITMNNEIIGKVSAEHDMRVEDEHISAVLLGRGTILPEDVKRTIRTAAEAHARGILDQLRELQVDLRTNPAIFIGGGSILFRTLLEHSSMVAQASFVTDPKANAIGYELLASSQLRGMP